MKKLNLVGLVLIVSCQLGFSQNLVVPMSNNIIINGKIDEGEWDQCTETKFVGGQKILFQRDDFFLNIGIIGEKGGFASVCVLSRDTVFVYHASTALITAKYVQQGKQWILVEEFGSNKKGEIRKAKSDAEKQKMNLNNYYWAANILPLPGQKNFILKNYSTMEYKIKFGKLPKTGVKISVVFFQFRAEVKYAYAPEGLNDGCLNSEMVRGGNVNKLNFNPDEWIQLQWGNDVKN